MTQLSHPSSFRCLSLTQQDPFMFCLVLVFLLTNPSDSHLIYLHILRVCVSCSVVSDSLWLHGLYSAGSSGHWILQARILEGLPSLLQVIFMTQGSKQGLLHFKHVLYHLSHQGSSNNTGVGGHSLLQRIFPI